MPNFAVSAVKVFVIELTARNPFPVFESYKLLIGLPQEAGVGRALWLMAANAGNAQEAKSSTLEGETETDIEATSIPDDGTRTRILKAKRWRSGAVCSAYWRRWGFWPVVFSASSSALQRALELVLTEPLQIKRVQRELLLPGNISRATGQAVGDARPCAASSGRPQRLQFCREADVESGVLWITSSAFRER
ncbi:MAG: hypothetical protein U1E95_07755 [Rubrivivax sp.]